MNKGEICDWLDKETLRCIHDGKYCLHSNEMICGKWFGWCTEKI